MAATTSNVIDPGLQVTLIEESLIYGFQTRLPMLGFFIRKPEKSYPKAKRMQKVTVGFVPSQDVSTVRDYDIDSPGYTLQPSAVDPREITLEHDIYKAWGTEDTEELQFDLDLINDFTSLHVNNVGHRMMNDIHSVVTESAGYSVGTRSNPASFNITTDWERLNNAASGRKMPRDGRVFVCHSRLYNRLLNDPRVTYASAGILFPFLTGELPFLFGVPLIEADNDVLLGGPNENCYGYLARRDAILAAMHYIEPGGRRRSNSASNYAELTIDGTGFVLGSRSFYSDDNRTDTMVIDGLYGKAKGNTGALVMCKEPVT